MILALPAIASLARRYWWIGGILAFSLALGLLLYDRMQTRMERDAARQQRDTALAQVDALTAQVMANEAASIERMADQTKIERAKDEVVSEIRKAPDAVPVAGGARVRFNCLRLKRAGTDTARLPACRGLTL